MQIPPFLERLLLSNEAVFKNASLGLSGQNMVFVPTGKTAVLLEVSIEPFVNAVDGAFMDLITNGYRAENSIAAYIQAMRRIHFQLQIINDKYSTYINLANEFELQNSTTQFVPGDAPKLSQFINLQFKGKREELFIYCDRSMYFNLIYPHKTPEEGAQIPGLIPTYDTPANAFLPKIQNIPESPVTFNKNPLEDYVTKVEVQSAALEQYYPVNHQTNPAFSPEFPQMEYLHFFNRDNYSTIRQPVPTNTDIQFHDLFTLPLINVKYALLNKRADDYGITRPGK
jgi:hypothetical protein